MSSIQGVNDNLLLINYFMVCIFNLMDVVNVGVYDVDFVINFIKFLEVLFIIFFKVNISLSDIQFVMRLDEEYKKFIVNKVFENSEEIVIVNVRN